MPSPKVSTVAALSETTRLLSDLYEAVAVIYSKKLDAPLGIVKVESGSSVRIDCKGLGDVVKHLKSFVLEAWHKVRHKRAEEVIENNKALLSSLAVSDHINVRESHHGLSPEEAENLRRRVIKDALGLFACGALIAEIPSEEYIDNDKLLKGFAPKLLTEGTKPTKVPKKEGQAKRKGAAPKKSPKKR